MTDDPVTTSWSARSARGCDRRPIGPTSAYRWSPGRTPGPGPAGAAAGPWSVRWQRSWPCPAWRWRCSRGTVRTPAAGPRGRPSPRRRPRSPSGAPSRGTDLTVDVPADWGWGTAPIVGDEGLRCAAGLERWCSAAGRKQVNPDDLDAVGRPADHALRRLPGGRRTGHPRRRTSGWARTSSPAPRSSATATSRRPSRRSAPRSPSPPRTRRVRQQIIDSARATTDVRGVAAGAARGRLDARSRGHATGALGARSAPTSRGGDGFDLTYAATLDEATAQATVRTAGTPGSGTARRRSAGRRRRVRRDHVHRRRPLRRARRSPRTVVIDPVCQEFQGSPGWSRRSATTGCCPWSRNGLQAVLRALHRDARLMATRRSAAAPSPRRRGRSPRRCGPCP